MPPMASDGVIKKIPPTVDGRSRAASPSNRRKERHSVAKPARENPRDGDEK